MNKGVYKMNKAFLKRVSLWLKRFSRSNHGPLADPAIVPKTCWAVVAKGITASQLNRVLRSEDGHVCEDLYFGNSVGVTDRSH